MLLPTPLGAGCCWLLLQVTAPSVLQENAALRKERDALQRQVSSLTQQLSAAEAGSQAAALAAASERAHAARALAAAQRQLGVAIARLGHLERRQQQQQEQLHEVRPVHWLFSSTWVVRARLLARAALQTQQRHNVLHAAAAVAAGACAA